jgi:hypothetical protein
MHVSALDLFVDWDRVSMELAMTDPHSRRLHAMCQDHDSTVQLVILVHGEFQVSTMKPHKGHWVAHCKTREINSSILDAEATVGSNALGFYNVRRERRRSWRRSMSLIFPRETTSGAQVRDWWKSEEHKHD